MNAGRSPVNLAASVEQYGSCYCLNSKEWMQLLLDINIDIKNRMNDFVLDTNIVANKRQ